MLFGMAIDINTVHQLMLTHFAKQQSLSRTSHSIAADQY